MLRRLTLSLMCAIFLLQSSCGTMLYPERRGQTSGRIDPAVALLNGVGVLLYVIPGLVAFGIDFYTGAIYLPGSRRRRLESEPMQAHTGEEEANSTLIIHQRILPQLDEASIEQALYELHGQVIELSAAQIEATPMKNVDALKSSLQTLTP